MGSNLARQNSFFFSSLSSQQCVLHSGPSRRCNTADFPIKMKAQLCCLRRSKLNKHILRKKSWFITFIQFKCLSFYLNHNLVVLCQVIGFLQLENVFQELRKSLDRRLGGKQEKNRCVTEDFASFNVRWFKKFSSQLERIFSVQKEPSHF